MRMVHVTIRTSNMDASVNFYEDVVGLKIQRDLRPMGGNIVFLAEKEGDTRVELIENSEEAFEGKGISMGFETVKADEFRQELMTKGYEVTPMISPNPGVRFFFVDDPSGVSVQFIEYLD